MIAGCQAAWAFFGGVFAVLIPDNLKPVIADADAVNPQFSQGWLDYASHAGFLTDPARVASPKDKPRVERAAFHDELHVPRLHRSRRVAPTEEDVGLRRLPRRRAAPGSHWRATGLPGGYHRAHGPPAR